MPHYLNFYLVLLLAPTFLPSEVVAAAFTAGNLRGFVGQKALPANRAKPGNLCASKVFLGVTRTAEYNAVITSEKQRDAPSGIGIDSMVHNQYIRSGAELAATTLGNKFLRKFHEAKRLPPSAHTVIRLSLRLIYSSSDTAAWQTAITPVASLYIGGCSNEGLTTRCTMTLSVSSSSAVRTTSLSPASVTFLAAKTGSLFASFFPVVEFYITDLTSCIRLLVPLVVLDEAGAAQAKSCNSFLFFASHANHLTSFRVPTSIMPEYEAKSRR